MLELRPPAHRFAAGGAFPRWARNPGTGEPPATATRLVPQTVSVHHDTAHPSSVTLPVLG